MKRRAPKGGYDFESKELFRSWVWKLIARHTALDVRPQVLLMPSLEGSEIREALRRRFQQEQMHCVDDSPAVIAVLRRAENFPKVNGYGVALDVAHERIAAKGVRLRAASIDLCANANWGTADLLARCSAADAWSTGALIVVNVLRGREPHYTTQSISLTPLVRKSKWFQMAADACVCDGGPAMNVFDLWRVWLLAYTLPLHIAVPLAVRLYVSSNNQSFLSVAFKMYRTADVRRALTVREKWQRRAAQVFATNVSLSNSLGVLTEVGALSEEEWGIPESKVARALSRDNSMLGFHLPEIVYEMLDRHGQFFDKDDAA